MAGEGFFDLGEMIAGGGIDREGARLEGLDTGSKIQARRATTVNALAQARLRADEHDAKLGLAEAIEELGLPPEMAVHLRAGGTIADLTKGLESQQEVGFRSTVADTAVPFDERQAAAQAISGKPVDPFQIEGGLFADIFNPGEAPLVAPESAVDAEATRALGQQRVAAAELSDERRLHPERFKATTNINLSQQPLSEQILDPEGDPGISVIPEGFRAEEAFGVESFFKGGVNALTDFVGLGINFPAQAQAETVLQEISSRIQIALRADVPGGRIPVSVQELLKVYAEDPTQLFRGDELSRLNFNTTLTSMKRSLKRIRDQIDAPTKKTPTMQGKLTSGLFAMTDIVKDLEDILASFERTEGAADTAGLADAATTSDAIQTESGGSFTVEP